MGFVPRIYKNTSLFLGILCLSLFISSAHASTKILVWGDSLSAAYGIPVEKGWVSLLEEELGDEFEIINGSISGETTQGGLTRLPAALKTHAPDLLILELGANDGLRGIPPQVSKSNLQQMILKSKQAEAEVILFGMKIPPNYGPAYSEVFEAQFDQLAKDYQLPYIPFFLESVIGNLDYFQADQLHPTAEAQAIILESILPTLKNAFENTTQDAASQTKLDTDDSTPDKTIDSTSKTEVIKNPA